ncbi:MAG: hypothetical protein CL678_08805 [Bdellovibrionaceae bacterium]|nr:hypothetical protein [Pseudobdellovibrionaceae bacterium]|tara:strand:- start:3608 stop:4534 length:927 start_codon:yes stop_codon:yes gene_type:complete
MIKLGFIFLMTSQLGWSYILPPDYVVKKMARSRKGMNLVRVVSEVLPLDASGEKGSPFFYEETYYDSLSRVLQSRIIDDQERTLYLMRRNFPIPVIPEKEKDQKVILKALQSQNLVANPEIPLLPMVIFSSDAEPLRQTLLARKFPMNVRDDHPFLPVEKENPTLDENGEWVEPKLPVPVPKPSLVYKILKRMDGMIAWVYGDPKTNEPQLWVQKDSFLPIKIVQFQDNHRNELKMTQYTYQKGFPYPREIVWIKDTVPQMMYSLKTIEINPLHKKLISDTKVGWSDAGLSLSEEQKAIILEFYSLIR